MTDEELAAFAHRNVVTRSLGSKDELEPDGLRQQGCAGRPLPAVLPTVCGARFPTRRSATILKSTDDIEAACQLLVDAANEAGGPDNISAILVRVNGGPREQSR